MSVPRPVHTYLVVPEAGFFPDGSETLLDCPSPLGDSGEFGQDAAGRAEAQVVGDVGRIGDRPSGKQPVRILSSRPVKVYPGPVSDTMPHHIVTVTETVPHRFRQFVNHLAGGADPQVCRGHPAVARNLEDMGDAPLLQQSPQILRPPIEDAGRDPSERHICIESSAEHCLGQISGAPVPHRVIDAGRMAPVPIVHPLFWQVQLPVDQAPTSLGCVRQEYPGLRVFGPPRVRYPGPHPSRPVTSLRETLVTDNQQAPPDITDHLDHQVTHIVAHAILIPRCCIQQPLHTLRAGLARRLRQGPAVLALDTAQESVDVSRHPPARFDTGESMCEPGAEDRECGRRRSPLPTVDPVSRVRAIRFVGHDLSL
ncbi:hypothetical protein YT1_1167 [Rhodococcus ruber]|nr:hypothetical protein YT1_1167 [Rhodococcus ruber]